MNDMAVKYGVMAQEYSAIKEIN